MFAFNQIRRTAAAAVGALLLTTVAIGAAVGPAQAGSVHAPAYAEVTISDRANG